MPYGGRHAAVERPLVFHRSARYIFISFGITGPIVVSFLVYTLEGVSRVANFITADEESK